MSEKDEIEISNIVHLYDVILISCFSRNIDPEQIFVFFSPESPSYVIHGEHRHAMTKFDNHFINWTMTYRTDSDVFAPYQESKVMNKIIDEGGKWIDSKLAKKKKVAVTNPNLSFPM